MQDPFEEYPVGPTEEALTGVQRTVQATIAWSPPEADAHSELKHTLAIGDVLAVTAVKKIDWMEGFKMNDPDHKSLLFPSSAVRPVRVSSLLSTAEPEASGAGRQQVPTAKEVAAITRITLQEAPATPTKTDVEVSDLTGPQVDSPTSPKTPASLARSDRSSAPRSIPTSVVDAVRNVDEDLANLHALMGAPDNR